MFNFIVPPLIVGIITAGIYGLFELFARRKERLAIIEKIGDRLDGSAFEGKLGLPSYMRNFSFSALKGGCLLVGIGLGLLVGLLISLGMIEAEFIPRDRWWRQDYVGVVFGASVLLFGGIGLLIAFFLELKIAGKNKQED